MPPTRLSRRTAAALASLATAAAAALTLTVAATPSSAAADCSGGYVGLTYDDGPNSGTTTALLNALTSAGLRATFFNIGQRVQQNSALARAQVSAGMWVGNHSWTHPHLPQMSSQQITSELTQTQQAIQQATGQTPRLFRPPYGETNATIRSIESQLGLTEVLWDVDSQDWNGASTSAIVQAAGRLQNGQVILMHDGYQTTIQAVPQIASNLASRNLCAGMISTSTGRAVAPDGGNPTTPPTTRPPTTPPTTTPPVTTPPPGGDGACRVGYTVSAWNTGLTASITITNTSSAAVNGWTLAFTLPSGQTITSGWNASYSPSSGAVTARNAAYNGSIAPSASVGIGFQATHTGNTGRPASFTLNGTACTVA
ncbi:polysaccharide deacetylase family protein [Phytohabitans sp. ZYX-F-186]|uniref:Polysaccharide deacetylase family protein n=1 Tax=Phytohabitans maris TaxID=3071409 RepID=A0ABU0ZJI2_9ACTN|nr:polysaccharide deacetylase family protein [Phytohabitans sp. ZYX-F-186]MDQ7907203.1 polysaccharide deacetylase family protein [Phytohabitans sp. ZYX-F-186]